MSDEKPWARLQIILFLTWLMIEIVFEKEETSYEKTYTHGNNTCFCCDDADCLNGRCLYRMRS